MQEPADQVLLEILKIPHHSIFWNPLSAVIAKDPLQREQLRRLVQFLSHSDGRVRQAAFDMLTAIQPDRPGSAQQTDLWENWLSKVEASAGIAASVATNRWITQGWPPVEDLYVDIVRVRAEFASQPTKRLLGDQPRLAATKRLIRYLRHPDRRLRVAADDTLRNLHGERPGTPDMPELWENWLRTLEESRQ